MSKLHDFKNAEISATEQSNAQGALSQNERLYNISARRFKIASRKATQTLGRIGRLNDQLSRTQDPAKIERLLGILGRLDGVLMTRTDRLINKSDRIFDENSTGFASRR